MISVVTVARNAATCIKDTIDSILFQKSVDFEFVFVDGASTDGTLQVVLDMMDGYKQTKANMEFKYISEPDNGVFDGMNKGGGKLATGQFVIFLNAGDRFYSENVLSDFESEIIKNPGYDAYYGDTLMCYYEGTGVWKEGEGSILNPIMPFSHQSVIVKTELLRAYPFDCSFRIVADLKFFKTLREQSCKFFHINKIISVYDAKDGISDSEKNYYKQILEIDRVHNMDNSNFYFLRKIVLKCIAIVRRLIKTLLPKSIINPYMKNKKTHIEWID